MANRVLREPCEHGRYERHVVNINVSCPGGREVTDDDLRLLLDDLAKRDAEERQIPGPF